MKRTYLVNLVIFLILIFYTNLVKTQGFFMALIIRQDIIWYIIVLPLFILICLFGILYQLFNIDLKNKKKLTSQIISLLTSLYLFLFLILFTRIYLTSSIAAFILLSVLPVFGILSPIILISLFKYIDNKKTIKK